MAVKDFMSGEVHSIAIVAASKLSVDAETTYSQCVYCDPRMLNKSSIDPARDRAGIALSNEFISRANQANGTPVSAADISKRIAL
jgi:hypothetical protein